MAGPLWEPLSPSLPLWHRASLALTLSGSVLSPAPIPPPRPVLSAQAPDTSTFPFSPLVGSSPCLAGLGCLDLLPTPRRRSFSTARRRQSGVCVCVLGAGDILARRSGPASQVSWRSGHSRGDQGAYPVAAPRLAGQSSQED